MRIEKRDITVSHRNNKLSGILQKPEYSSSLVIFSHGSGSSRFSVRNTFVANKLNEKNIATVLIDLLTEDEDSIYANRFDIDLLTGRLVEATNQLRLLPEYKEFSFGYFGASTGAASALNAAARLGGEIHAVVSRGGRPDLAEASLTRVNCPTLLIVGSLDEEVLEKNRFAYERLRCEKKLEIVQGASHLFEEKGKLEEAAKIAGSWFTKHLHAKKLVRNDL